MPIQANLPATSAGSAPNPPIALTPLSKNDGLPDVFITAVGGNHLFHNQGGGKFVEVTAAAGVAGAADGWSTSAAWIDYDNDGKLDLFVCNYVRWSPELDRAAPFELPNIG